MKATKVSMELGGKTLQFETGYLAKQAAGSVVGTLGETSVFASVCTADPRPGINFFPLSVDYREKYQAAGKFPGGFMKREGRPTTKEILTCRMIDRPVRPLFPSSYNDEVQVCAFVVQYDLINDPDIVAMNTAFAALHLADIPFMGPIGAVRVGRVDGEFILNPTVEQVEGEEINLIVAGSADAITMVEGHASEISEELFLEALTFGHDAVREICGLMDKLAKEAGRDAKTEYVAPEVEVHPIVDVVTNEYREKLTEAILTQGKFERSGAVRDLRNKVIAEHVAADDNEAREKTTAIKDGWYKLEKQICRELTLSGRRIDNRAPNEILPIDIQIGYQSRLHGSAVFTRGETQALAVCTLGTLRDQQIVDGIRPEFKKKFDLQYNFPPYCVGEVRMMRGVSRREIGHGNLAEHALLAITPEPEDFPYTIRIISDILESNGSSSMATVCGGTLAMMDAGVPIKQPVAGIAMGLLMDEDTGKTVVLSDILGNEDHFGDMDFKVTGTGRGITAVQMDIKVAGITQQIMAEALTQAREGRLHILKEMMKAIERPSEAISKYAPKILRTKVPVDKIGLVIGPGGKMIKRIQEETGATVEIEDDGTVHISSTEGGDAEAAKSHIDMLCAEVEVGQTYMGRVVSIKDFGAFVEILPGQEGLCHVSELSDEFVSNVADVVKMGDRFEVKVIARDEQDRIKLSRRVLLMEGREGEAGAEAGGDGGDRPPRRDGNRGGDRGPRRDGGNRGGDSAPRRDGGDRSD